MYETVIGSNRRNIQLFMPLLYCVAADNLKIRAKALAWRASCTETTTPVVFSMMFLVVLIDSHMLASYGILIQFHCKYESCTIHVFHVLK